MRVQRVKRHQNDEGVVAILVAVLIVLLAGMAAFVTDQGLAYSRKRQLQTAADGAVLAAAKQLQDNAAPGRTCASVLTAGQVGARASAVTYQALNGPSGSKLVTGPAPAGWSGDAGVAFRCNAVGNAEVTVANTGTSPAIFGGLFGAGDYVLSRTATAAMGPPGAIVGLRPFAVCQTAVDALLAADAAHPGSAQLITLDKVFNASSSGGTATPCGSAPGNWGTLDFNGGSNPVTDTSLWTDIGYNAVIDLGSGLSISFPGDPGFPSANAGNCSPADGCQHTVKLDGALNDIIGRQSVLPVFDVVTASGANTTYRVKGFLGITLCGWKIGNNSGTIPDPTYGGLACYDGSTPGVQLPPGNGSTINAFQVRVTRFIPIGDISSFCGLTASPAVACDTNLRLTQLIN